jgi:hypothetical protein
MKRLFLTLSPLLLLVAPAGAQEPAADAAIWHQLGSSPREIIIGSYSLELEERVVEDPDMRRWIPAIVPSPQAEAAAWIYRCMAGASVRYDAFLGAERVRFERSLSFRLGTEHLPPEQADSVVQQVYDRNHNGRLSRRELERGNAAMERFFIARVRAAAQPGAGYTPIPALPTATAFADAWLSHQADMAAVDPHDCPDCAGVPHLDKLAALVGYLQEYAAPMEGAHAAVFAPGYNQVFLTVDPAPRRPRRPLLLGRGRPAPGRHLAGRNPRSRHRRPGVPRLQLQRDHPPLGAGRPRRRQPVDVRGARRPGPQPAPPPPPGRRPPRARAQLRGARVVRGGAGRGGARPRGRGLARLVGPAYSTVTPTLAMNTGSLSSLRLSQRRNTSTVSAPAGRSSTASSMS